MHRFTATQYHMAKNLDKKIQLAKLRNRELLRLLRFGSPKLQIQARLELDKRIEAPSAP